MSEPLLLLAAAALSFSGMVWLALSMEVHWAQVVPGAGGGAGTGAASPARLARVFRWLGPAALSLAALLCGAADRPSMAVLVWFQLQAGAALAVALVLSHRPRWLRAWALA